MFFCERSFVLSKRVPIVLDRFWFIELVNSSTTYVYFTVLIE